MESTNFVTYNMPEITCEEAEAAVDAFEYKDIEDCAWLIATYLIDRCLEVPACYALEISEFTEIWDGDCDCLIRGFSREEQLARIDAVFKLTWSAIEREIRRQHEKDAQIMLKLRNLLVANHPA